MTLVLETTKFVYSEIKLKDKFYTVLTSCLGSTDCFKTSAVIDVFTDFVSKLSNTRIQEFLDSHKATSAIKECTASVSGQNLWDTFFTQHVNSKSKKWLLLWHCMTKNECIHTYCETPKIYVFCHISFSLVEHHLMYLRINLCSQCHCDGQRQSAQPTGLPLIQCRLQHPACHQLIFCTDWRVIPQHYQILSKDWQNGLGNGLKIHTKWLKSIYADLEQIPGCNR